MKIDKSIESKGIGTTPINANDLMVTIIRKMIFKALKNLKWGKLSIIEGHQVYIFGEEYQGKHGSIKIFDSSFYLDIFTKGSIGAAEAYIQKKWDSDNLSGALEIFAVNKTVLSGLDSGFVNFLKPVRFVEYWQKRNTIEGSKKNILAHYDLPDGLFRLFLDQSMFYSSAIYPTETSSLEEAQDFKMKEIAEKLSIKPGMKILEIGTGWGAMAVFLAKNYDCHVTTTTISENQYQEAQRRIKENGLENKVTLLKEDYRNLTGIYDRVVSIEMIEAVGYDFLGGYLNKISNSLKEDGLALIQAITIVDQEFDRAVNEVDFIKKYIFPGSFIPSIGAIVNKANTNTNMRLISQFDFAQHYARTLSDWSIRFNQKIDQLESLGLNQEFARMWNFYFDYCIAGFNSRATGVSHLVFAKPLNRNNNIR